MRCLLAAVFIALNMMGSATAARLVVFAPASLTEVLREIAPVWEARHGDKIVFNFGNSPMLAKQFSLGAPAQIIIFADKQWMDWVQDRGLIENNTRHIVAENDLVLITPKDRAQKIEISRSLDVASLLGPDGRLAIGDTTSLPAGIYAKQALSNLGLWDAVHTRLATMDSLRGVLMLVDRGEAPLGIVYTTEAALSANVQIAGVFPADSYAPVQYPIAAAKGATAPDASAFMSFLGTTDATDIFVRHGFRVPSQP